MQQRASSLWISCLVLFISFFFFFQFHVTTNFSNLFAHFCGNFNFLKLFNSISFPILFNKFFFHRSVTTLLDFTLRRFIIFCICFNSFYIFQIKRKRRTRKLDNWRVNARTHWRRKIMKIIQQLSLDVYNRRYSREQIYFTNVSASFAITTCIWLNPSRCTRSLQGRMNLHREIGHRGSTL